MVRKEMRQILEFNDLEDEVATHFLKLNSDIQTLNDNQDLILEFIHNHFNADPQHPPSELPSEEEIPAPSERAFSADEEREEEAFMEEFRGKLKEARKKDKIE